MQTEGNASQSKDGILAELLRVAVGNGRYATSQELLLWAFVPMLHRISRQVITRSSGLAPDDVAQHVVTALLESLSSPEFSGRHSHLAFAIARLLRRNAFAWAERESRSALHGFGSVDSLERCRQQGVLSEQDLELLVQCKLDESPRAEYSNASRQRMKRLLAKLRRAAKRPRRTQFDPTQLRLF